MDAHQDLDRVRMAGDIGGPATAPQLTLSHRGVGGALIMRGNPITWIVDALGCVPFLHFAGQPSAASSQALAALPEQGTPPDFTGTPGVLQAGGQATAPVPNPATTGTPDISQMNTSLAPPATPAPAAPAPVATIGAPAAATPVVTSRQQGVPTVSQAGPFGYISLADQLRGKH